MQGIKQLAWSSVKVLASHGGQCTGPHCDPGPVASQFFALGQRAYMQGFDNGSTQFAAFETALQFARRCIDVGISTDYGDMVKMAAWAYTTAGNSNDQAKMQSALESLGSSDLPSGTLLALPQPTTARMTTICPRPISRTSGRCCSRANQ